MIMDVDGLATVAYVETKSSDDDREKKVKMGINKMRVLLHAL